MLSLSTRVRNSPYVAEKSWRLFLYLLPSRPLLWATDRQCELYPTHMGSRFLSASHWHSFSQGPLDRCEVLRGLLKLTRKTRPAPWCSLHSCLDFALDFYVLLFLQTAAHAKTWHRLGAAPLSQNQSTRAGGQEKSVSGCHTTHKLLSLAALLSILSVSFLRIH